MTVKRRRQGMAGSILEQFAELKSDYEIGKASRYERAKTGIMTLGSHADYHYRTEAAYFGAMEMAREMTRNNPLVMQGVRRLVANVVGRGRMNPLNRRKQRERSGDLLSLLSPLPPVQDSNDLQFANLVAAKIQSCYTILREMDAGAPVLPFAGGGDHSETTETRPDGETRTLTDIAPGFEIYGYKGEKLRGFVPTLPGLQFFEHSQMLLGILAVNLDLPLCVFLLDASETNYSGFRGAIDQARQRWREIQSWMMGSFHGPVYEWKVRQWAVTDSALRKAVERADSLRASLAAATSWCRHTPRRRRFRIRPYCTPCAHRSHPPVYFRSGGGRPVAPSIWRQLGRVHAQSFCASVCVAKRGADVP